MNRKRKTIPAMLVAAAHAADKPQVTSKWTRRQNNPAQKPLPILGAALAGVTGFALVLALSHAVNAEAATQPSTEGEQTLPEISVTASGEEDGYTVRESSSATKLTLSPRETPQSMTVITRERIDDQDLTSMRKVLDNTPGIYSNAYDTERVLFYSRGFLIDTLMYDGVPALSSSTGSIDETLDTALYERIEVVRGATGLMTGAGNPAASINLVRKHADSRSSMFSLDLTAGSWGNRRVEVDASTPLNADASVRARGVAVSEDTDSYQALYNKKTYVLYGIVDADLSPATRVSLGFDYQNNKPRSNTWGSFPLFLADGTMANWPRSVTTATDWSYWDRKTQTVFGELSHNFDNGWSLRSTLSHRRFNEDAALFYVYGFPDPTTGTGLDPFAYRSKSKVIENSLDLYASGPFELLGRKHELVVGYNGSRAKNTGTEQNPVDDPLTVPTGNFFQWDGSYPEPAFQPATPLNDIKTNQDAVYAVARFSLAESLKLIAGTRYARTKVDSFDIYDSSAGPDHNTQYNFSKAIPYAGLVWDFLPQFSAYTSYTGIYKPQSNRGADGGYLDPMEGRSVEVGVKGEHFDRRLNTAFTVFDTRQDNVAAPVYDPITGDPILLGNGVAINQPIDTRTRGFEMEASGHLSNDWQGSFGWTRYLTRDGFGQPIRTYIPSTLIRLFATWEPKHLVDHLSLGAGVNWQSVSSTVVGSPSGAVDLRQGSLSQISLMARYQFTPKLSFQFNVNNVFDKKFYVLDEYDNTYYGAPANYAVTLRASY